MSKHTDRIVCGESFGDGITCDMQFDHHPNCDEAPTHSGIDPDTGRRVWKHMLDLKRAES